VATAVERSIGGDLRRRAARGTVVNAAYLVFLNFLGFFKGFAVAAFLTTQDYGVWGLLAVTLVPLFDLLRVGVDDKYIQQDEEDQEKAFHLAFTLQLMLSGLFVGLLVLVLPLYALAFGEWSILLPGWVIALCIPAIALQSPLWTFYRRMDFVQQRKLQSFDPVVGLLITMGLAAAGAGYWSLVVGVVAGSWAAAIAAVRASPYKLALHYERGKLREYANFSGPLLFSAGSAIVLAQVPVLIAQRTLGLAAIGAIAIATTISNYANRVDDIVTETLYPAICAVKDRVELLRESFVKSNRLALLWAMPVGVGLVLFGPDVVHFFLGTRWEIATVAIQIFGLCAAVNQIGFNWTAFYRALGNTKPIAVASGVMVVAVLGIAVPGLLIGGVDGFAIGMGGAILCLVALRIHYLGRLFGVGTVVRNSARGALPVIPAAAAVLAVRYGFEGGERTLADALGEIAVFLVTAGLATLASERSLLREFRGYLGRSSEVAPA
jgi:PST family polysaccharide transporter